MDATKLRQIFEKLDDALEHPTELLIRGGAATLAHGLEQRVTLDIDVLPPEETLILPRPDPDRGYDTVFRGLHLTVRTPPAADLIIGKLKRLEPDDVADVAFLIKRFRLSKADLAESFARLPDRFKTDPVVQDNFRYIIEDCL